MVRDVVGRGKEREVKLRGVVDAFSGAGAGRSAGGSGEGSRMGSGTATPRDRDRNSSREGNYQSMTEVMQDQDLLIGQGGRGFDDVDGKSFPLHLTTLKGTGKLIDDDDGHVSPCE